MYSVRRILPVVASTMLLSTPAFASDARTMALGGSAIAHAKGAHGAMENPASMMAMKRAGDNFHLRFGLSADLRDSGTFADTLTEDANENLVSDIETQIDDLSNRQVQCDPIFGDADDVCIDNTQDLSDLSNQLLDAINGVEDGSIDLQLTADLGVAVTSASYPYAVSIKLRGTGSAGPDIVESDKDYLREFADLLDNNTLTLDEIRNSTYLEANALGIPLGVQQPEDVLLSSGSSSALLRTQLGISMASTINIAGYAVDAGITPKFSSLSAYHLNTSIADELDDDAVDLVDQFEDSEVTESSFTADIGAAFDLNQYPIRLAAVVRNLIPENIETEDGFEFETTPQLIVGAAFQKNKLSLTGDLALNKAKVDNLETQIIAVGAEFGTKNFAIRGGLSYEGGRDVDKTALSFGFGLGPLQVGIRGTDTYSMQSSIDLAYSF